MPDQDKFRVVEEDTNPAHHFVALFDDFFDDGLHLLTPSEFMIFAVLRKFANYKTGEAWPSVSTICKLTGLSDQTVRTNLKNLQAKGCISIQHRYDPEKKQHLSSVYTVYANPTQWKIFQDEQKNEVKKMPVSSDLIRQNQSFSEETDKIVCLQEKDTTQVYLCQCSAEKYDMDWLHDHYDYDALIEVVDKSEADMLMSYIYDIVNSKQKTMSVEGTPLSSQVVIQRILDLELDDLDFVLTKFKSTTTEIRNTKAYIRTIMYNAKAQSHAEIKNALHRDNVI